MCLTHFSISLWDCLVVECREDVRYQTYDFQDVVNKLLGRFYIIP